MEMGSQEYNIYLASRLQEVEGKLHIFEQYILNQANLSMEKRHLAEREESIMHMFVQTLRGEANQPETVTVVYENASDPIPTDIVSPTPNSGDLQNETPSSRQELLGLAHTLSNIRLFGVTSSQETESSDNIEPIPYDGHQGVLTVTDGQLQDQQQQVQNFEKSQPGQQQQLEIVIEKVEGRVSRRQSAAKAKNSSDLLISPSKGRRNIHQMLAKSPPRLVAASPPRQVFNFARSPPRLVATSPSRQVINLPRSPASVTRKSSPIRERYSKKRKTKKPVRFGGTDTKRRSLGLTNWNRTTNGFDSAEEMDGSNSNSISVGTSGRDPIVVSKPSDSLKDDFISHAKSEEEEIKVNVLFRSSRLEVIEGFQVAEEASIPQPVKIPRRSRVARAKANGIKTPPGSSGFKDSANGTFVIQPPDEMKDFVEMSQKKNPPGRKGQVVKKKRKPPSGIPDKTPQICPICGKTLRTVHSLVSHLRSHTGQKPYQCGQCDARFSQNSSLSRHVLTHSGEKKFACEICDKTFITKYDRLIHANRHKKQAQTCSKCKKSFHDTRYFKVHQKNCTSDTKHICPYCMKDFKDPKYWRKHTRDCGLKTVAPIPTTNVSMK